MSLPQAAARCGFRTFCWLATGIFLASILPRANASSPPLTCNPRNLQFGSVQVGDKRILSAVITNRGADSVTLSTETTTGAGFLVSGMALPITLEPGQSFTFSITFTPESAGAINGSLMLAGPAGATLVMPLMGTAVSAGNLLSSPATIDFGNVPLGKASQRMGTLSVTGASVTVYSAHITSPEFTLSGLQLPMTIAAGQMVLYVVTFRPRSSGNTSALLSFQSNAVNSQAVGALDGDGYPLETFTVSLSWQPSSSQVAGYNVYRGTTSGGPYAMINSTLDPVTSYVDNSAMGGQTYYYVTTAVNSNGQQSAYSNQVEVNVP